MGPNYPKIKGIQRNSKDIRMASFGISTGPRGRPRPSWDAAQPMDSTDDDAWAWQCPWESWVARLDDPEHGISRHHGEGHCSLGMVYD